MTEIASDVPASRSRSGQPSSSSSQPRSGDAFHAALSDAMSASGRNAKDRGTAAGPAPGRDRGQSAQDAQTRPGSYPTGTADRLRAALAAVTDGSATSSEDAGARRAGATAARDGADAGTASGTGRTARGANARALDAGVLARAADTPGRLSQGGSPNASAQGAAAGPDRIAAAFKHAATMAGATPASPTPNGERPAVRLGDTVHALAADGEESGTAPALALSDAIHLALSQSLRDDGAKERPRGQSADERSQSIRIVRGGAAHKTVQGQALTDSGATSPMTVQLVKQEVHLPPVRPRVILQAMEKAAIAAPIEVREDTVVAQLRSAILPERGADGSLRPELQTSRAPLPTTQGEVVKVVELMLKPASLGLVSVTLRLTPSGLRIAVNASERETAERLKDHEGQLQSLFGDAGYRDGAVEVAVQSRLRALAPRPAPLYGGRL